DALPEPAFDACPFGGADDPGDEVEGQDVFGSAVVAVHVERDAHLEEGEFGGALAAGEFPVRERFHVSDERACAGAGFAGFAEHLVEEVRGVVMIESHGMRATARDAAAMDWTAASKHPGCQWGGSLDSTA